MATKGRKSINYLLRTWRRCADRMSELDKSNLKRLYNGLKQLDKEEYTFLWDKYYLSTEPMPISDAIMAEKYGMTLNEYRRKRNDIQNKLQDLIEDDQQPLREKEFVGKVTTLTDIRAEILADKIEVYKAKKTKNIK